MYLFKEFPFEDLWFLKLLNFFKISKDPFANLPQITLLQKLINFLAKDKSATIYQTQIWFEDDPNFLALTRT